MKKYLIAIVIFLSLFVGCTESDGNSQNNSKETESSTYTNMNVFQDDSLNSENQQENQQTNSSDLESGIDIQYKTVLNDKHQICVFITNNTGRRIDDLEIQALFKDQSGKTVSEDKDGHDVFLPGTTVVSYLSSDVDYAKIEFVKTLEPDRNPRYENHMEKIMINSHQSGEKIIVEITNNDNVKIDEVEYVLVFFKGDDVVSKGTTKDVTDIPAGKTVTESVYCPSEKFDTYKIYINQAHTFGF